MKKSKVEKKVLYVKKKAISEVQRVKQVKVLDEFREFIARGNVLDLAVGVIIGGAFQSLVSSLTDNLISPILGCLTEVDFNDYTLSIGTLNLRYGAFLTDVINFLIMAFIVFLIVKIMNRILLKREVKEEEVEEKKEEVLPKDIQLLEEIRDLLQQNIEDKS